MTIQDSCIVYSFRDKKTGYYVGYDGFDTDFSKGMSAFIPQNQLTNQYNKSLYTVSYTELIDMMVKRTQHTKLWERLGGFDNLDIVQFSVNVGGISYTTTKFLNIILSDSDDESKESSCEQYVLGFD